MASSDTPIGRHLHEIVSSLSGVEYDIVIPPLGMPLGEPLPVACAAGGIALAACALRPPGAGEVTPEEAGVILLKLDGCGTSVCLQDETLRGTNHFRLALHRCLQGDHLTSEDGYSPTKRPRLLLLELRRGRRAPPTARGRGRLHLQRARRTLP